MQSRSGAPGNQPRDGDKPDVGKMIEIANRHAVHSPCRRASRKRPPGPPKLAAGVEQRLHLDQVARSKTLRERREASAKLFDGTTVLLGSAIELRQAQRGS